jgi:transglutaminase-like putative cysteine protease
MPRRSIVLAAGWLLAAGSATAASFPAIPEQHKNLTEVPGAPGAPAVVLFAVADVKLQDPVRDSSVSIFHVERRIKVLTAEGVTEYGEIAIPHSRQWRLSNFAARTVRPDGQVVPVDKKAIFERQSSRSERLYETVAAFPAVEPGAILDLQYDLYFDTYFFLQPWPFQSEIPTLRSEITYHIPDSLAVGSWGQGVPGREVKQDVKPEKDGRRLTVSSENLPAIPDEPFGLPPNDLTAKFMLVPHYFVTFGQRVPLMETWKELCSLVEINLYKPARGNSQQAKAKARALAASARGDRRAAAQLVYEHVRDHIATSGTYSVLTLAKKGVDEALATGQGSPADKALALQAMLEALKIDSDLVWAPDREDGLFDPAVPNPDWFERVLVRVRFDDEEVFLDPSDERLAFGRLRPGNEGQTAMLMSSKNPEAIQLPRRPHDANARKARVQLAIGEEGEVTGIGELALTGHHARANLDPRGKQEDLEKRWQDWLSGRFPGFEVSAVTVRQEPSDQQVTVTWALAHQEEEVLGDEVTLHPSRPLGPLRQIFELPPERRRSPAILSFADSDQLEVTLTWPPDWQLERAPAALDRSTAAGRAVLEVQQEADRLVLSRRFDITSTLFSDSTAYAAVRTLYEAMEKKDAEAVVILRR